MDGLLDFFSADEGRKRREARDQFVGNLVNGLLGPTGIPERLGLLSEIFNPVVGVEQAGSAARTVANPDASWQDRVGATGRMASEIAGVVAPAAAVRFTGIGGDDAARALEEGLLGMSASPGAVAGRDFAMDESGAIRAWHGSPHDFDKFSLDHIGTGEGAQAYGHGLYFAENEDVARQYKQALAQNGYDNTRNYQKALELGMSSGEFDQFESLARQTIPDADTLTRAFFDWNSDWAKVRNVPEEYAAVKAFAQDYLDNFPQGRLYEVEINANPEDFLDWDAPLSEQPEKVRKAVQKAAPVEKNVFGRWFVNIPGVDHQSYKTKREAITAATSRIANVPERAAALREAGIPGIRYLDQGSRGAGDGTRNYVVFDDNLISIIKKYGIAGAAAMLGMSAEDLQAQADNQGLLGPQQTSAGPIPRADGGLLQ